MKMHKDAHNFSNCSMVPGRVEVMVTPYVTHIFQNALTKRDEDEDGRDFVYIVSADGRISGALAKFYPGSYESIKVYH